MSVVSACPIPEGAFLAAYPPRGAYADCYSTLVPQQVPLERYVASFYTTWLFKLERWILQLASKPSTDAGAEHLARGATDSFAAWSVENRDPSQILLCDYTGRTRSWLKVDALGESTRLYFGSAVVPREKPDGSGARLGFPFDLLLDFHRAYSVALLHAARARVMRARG
jgi:hypothetical protein